MNEKEGKRK